MDNNVNNKDNKKRLYKLIIAAVALVIIIIILLLSFKDCSFIDDIIGKDSETETGDPSGTDSERETNASGQILPDYPPMETDPGLKPIPGDDETSTSTRSSVTISYTTKFVLNKTDKIITFNYKNRAKSNQDQMLVIKVGDYEIARSGIIPPGSQLTSLDVTDEAIEVLIAGGYKAALHIGNYDPETGEKAMVETKANIVIQVQE